MNAHGRACWAGCACQAKALLGPDKHKQRWRATAHTVRRAHGIQVENLRLTPGDSLGALGTQGAQVGQDSTGPRGPRGRSWPLTTIPGRVLVVYVLKRILNTQTKLRLLSNIRPLGSCGSAHCGSATDHCGNAIVTRISRLKAAYQELL